MDLERLVKAITLEVLKHMEITNHDTPPPLKKLLVLEETDSKEEERYFQSIKGRYQVEGIESYHQGQSINYYDAIIIPYLPIKEMVNIGIGVRNGDISEITSEAILLGVKVYVLKEGIDYRKYQKTSNIGYYQMMESYEKKLKELGIHIVDQDNFYESLNNHQKDMNNDNSSTIIDKRIITETDIEEFYSKGYEEIFLREKTIITPLAEDYIKQNRIAIFREK
ncbi:ethanolamine utilization protein [Natronincola peptidivorans]|uniref:Ethanolamine utilization protein n=1 Tax=Natronincola peptidivorans TaxID=426128 RepID=A0A1I0EUX8_9FIRM|nr:hypothetical protein [Natronincola peptidivorans]SET49399.1 ethanolamine utilization protein [Natronincola peptidivorans]